MTRGLVLLSLVWSLSSQAAGNVYAVLPTQGVGATTEAALVAQTMRLALQEQSLALVPASQVDNAVLAQTVACSQSVVACGRLVGQATGATHVLLSELWDQAGTLELKVALLDVRVESPPAWTVARTTTSSELGRLAKETALSLVSPSALSGFLSVTGTAGIEVVVDGVVGAVTPLVSPVRLPSGPHEVELRSAGAVSGRETVQIASSSTTTLQACVRDGAVTTSGCEAAGDSGGFGVPGYVGVASLGLGAAAGVVSAVSLAVASSSYETYKDSVGADGAALETHRGARTTALVSGVVGGALLVAGAAALVVELVVE
jgi:hypothetical protein